MKYWILGIVLFCVVSAGAVSLLVVPEYALEILAGMTAPLLMVVGSLVVLDRALKRSPETVSAVMTRSLGAKMLFCAAYVILLAVSFEMQLAPFATSFVVYFVILYSLEAAYLVKNAPKE